jgi:hypothetical protein
MPGRGTMPPADGLGYPPKSKLRHYNRRGNMTSLFKNDQEGKTNLYTTEEVTISVAHKRTRLRNGQMALSAIERDELTLTIMPVEPRSVIGRRSSGGVAYVDRTAAGVRSRLRRLRPEQAKALEKIDAMIGTLEAQIAELQKQRGQLLHQAWPKAESVKLDVENVGARTVVMRDDHS